MAQFLFEPASKALFKETKPPIKAMEPKIVETSKSMIVPSSKPQPIQQLSKLPQESQPKPDNKSTSSPKVVTFADIVKQPPII